MRMFEIPAGTMVIRGRIVDGRIQIDRRETVQERTLLTREDLLWDDVCAYNFPRQGMPIPSYASDVASGNMLFQLLFQNKITWEDPNEVLIVLSRLVKVH